MSAALGHCRAHTRVKSGAVAKLAGLLGEKHIGKVVGPRQAAGMGSQNPLVAALHRSLPPFLKLNLYREHYQSRASRDNEHGYLPRRACERFWARAIFG
jgi:hypothetical protein